MPYGKEAETTLQYHSPSCIVGKNGHASMKGLRLI
jgi:hypothetical protein